MTSGGKVLAILGIVFLVVLALLGIGVLILFIAFDGMHMIAMNNSDSGIAWLALAVIVVFLGGGIAGIVFLVRRLRGARLASPAVAGGAVTLAPLDTQVLRIALIAHFVLIAVSLALNFARASHTRLTLGVPADHTPFKWIIFGLASSIAYAAPYIAVFVFVMQPVIYRRALITAIVYAAVSFFSTFFWTSGYIFRSSSTPFLGMFAVGLAVDIWIAVAALTAFMRFPDRRNAAADFLLLSIASVFYLVVLHFGATTFASMLYRS